LAGIFKKWFTCKKFKAISSKFTLVVSMFGMGVTPTLVGAYGWEEKCSHVAISSSAFIKKNK